VSHLHVAEIPLIWLLVTEAATVAAGMWAVFKARNASTPT